MSSPPADQPDGQQRRVQRILKRARREVGVRDLLLFAVVRIWTAVLEVAAALYALVSRRRETDDSPQA